jgi:hypothetical protein
LDTLTNSSVVPGDGVHYLDMGIAMQCLSAQPGSKYVTLGVE